MFQREINLITFVECMFKGYSLRKLAEIVGVTWVTLFYWRHKLLSALKQIDFEQFDGIVEVTRHIFYTLKKGSVALKNVVHVSEAANLSIEG